MFRALLAVALALNAAGYLLNWFDRFRYYDEACHFLTPLAISGIAGSALLSRFRAAHDLGRAHFLLGLTLAGLLVGIAWEVFEWAIGIIGARADTVGDLAADCAGSLVGAALAWRRGRR